MTSALHSPDEAPVRPASFRSLDSINCYFVCRWKRPGVLNRPLHAGFYCDFTGRLVELLSGPNYVTHWPLDPVPSHLKSKVIRQMHPNAPCFLLYRCSFLSLTCCWRAPCTSRPPCPRTSGCPACRSAWPPPVRAGKHFHLKDSVQKILMKWPGGRAAWRVLDLETDQCVRSNHLSCHVMSVASGHNHAFMKKVRKCISPSPVCNMVGRK